MPRDIDQLRRDALAIWKAGVAGVSADRLMRDAVQVDDHWLVIDDEPLDLNEFERICVVGAGKAGAGMAAALEEILGPQLLAAKNVTGWVNVPADCVRPLARIHLHAARPAGVNEPTTEGIAGTESILKLVGSLTSRDLCIALISGGGSALLPAPTAGITLEDKQHVTTVLSAAGANIAELNLVRRHLSRVKGGGLARACTAARMISLIISDVIGNPLDVIASGPTVEAEPAPHLALEVLGRFDAQSAGVSQSVFDALDRQVARIQNAPPCNVQNIIIGNNAMAVDAAGVQAEKLGYSHAMIAATELEGPVEAIGRQLANMALSMRDGTGSDCLISGGEGTVRLAVPSQRGLGGRNQQLVLAALDTLSHHNPERIVLMSGGTDGEDGPTDAAGAILDPHTLSRAAALKLNPADYLRRNDAYHFFEAVDGLVKTGPTHTNVCDLRVVVVDQVKNSCTTGSASAN